MNTSRKNSSLKYFIILLVLLISFGLIDVFLWDICYWRKGLGFYPEVKTYENDLGLGNATLKVSFGSRPWIVLFEDFLHNEFDVRIFTCVFELNSSGDINLIRIIKATASIYHDSKYMGTFICENEGLVCFISTIFPVAPHYIFNVQGMVRVEINVQGNSQITSFPYSLSYEVPELSWLNAYGFLLIIFGQVIVIIVLIAVIFTIRRHSKPSPPPPYVLRLKTDT